MNIPFLLLSFIMNYFAPTKLVTNVQWVEESPMAANDVVYYNDKKLVWSDFRGEPEEGRAAAVTVSGFGYKANIFSKNGSGEFNIKVYCYFNKEKSWVKPGKTIPYILNHEQNHFDISYVAANVFVEKLKKARFTTANYERVLQKIYTEATDVMHQMQDDYDGQTRNGQLKDVQKRWNRIVEDKVAATR